MNVATSRATERSEGGGATDTAIAAVFRSEAARICTVLLRRFQNFELVEDSVQDAIVRALETWPIDGMPDNPAGWLLTVARRQALNRVKREALGHEKIRLIASDPAGAADDRLRLIFTCCHPALSRDGQVALTLRAVCGFSTAEIARAFLASEPTVAQRIVRAQRKIAAAGIPYRIPTAHDLADRIGEVMAVLYLMFNEGHLTTGGERSHHRNLAEEALWLGELLVRLLPPEPEPLGLVALMNLHLARAASRFDDQGGLVLLADQDRRLWDRDRINSAVALIATAGAFHRPGPYQLEAAIQALHAEAPSVPATDWAQIVVLYDMLIAIAPSPVVRMNRAIALRFTAGPSAALSELESLRDALTGYHLFHAARARMLLDLGRGEQARAAELQALDLTCNPAERALIQERLFRDD